MLNFKKFLVVKVKLLVNENIPSFNPGMFIYKIDCLIALFQF